MKISVLDSSEFPYYYEDYLKEISFEYTLLEELEISMNSFVHFVQNIPLDKIDFQYAANKWNLKEIILHIIDSERVFCYRAMRFARKDKTDLPGFDENWYTPNSGANDRSIRSLLEEFLAVRQATICLFKSFNQDQLIQIGNASGNRVSVRALGFITIVHQIHHTNVFKEKYLGF